MTSKDLQTPLLFSALAAVLAGGYPATAQEPDALSLRLTNVAAASDITTLTKPWHLKLAVKLEGPKGSAAQEGTVEVWRAGEESKTLFNFGSNTFAEYHHEGKQFFAHSGVPVPQLAFDVLDAVLHPGPSPKQMEGTTPESQKREVAKATMDCIVLSRALKPNGPAVQAAVPIGLFPTYCLTPQSDHLQLSYSLGDNTVVRSGIGKFLDREVTTSLSLLDGTSPLASAKLTALSSFSPSETEFVPPADASPEEHSIPLLSSATIAKLKTGGKVPEYPASARQAHVSGSVVMRAIIGADGHVAHLWLMSAGSPDLAFSALSAVRTWIYKPYLLNGEPTPVDTTITVNFNLSGG